MLFSATLALQSVVVTCANSDMYLYGIIFCNGDAIDLPLQSVTCIVDNGQINLDQRDKINSDLSRTWDWKWRGRADCCGI